ncbi:MAG: hypothetical protein Q9227_005244 [Pyrenula ochraceoflavens]
MAPVLLTETSGPVTVPSPKGCRILGLRHIQGWPKELKSDLAWECSNFESEDDYNLTLTEQHKFEIKNALCSFKTLGLDGNEVNLHNFPLLSLGARLKLAAFDLHIGKGFVNIRGLDPTEFSPEDNALVFLGLSSYIGEKRAKQDEDGNMMSK